MIPLIAYCYVNANSVWRPLWQIAISVTLLFCNFFSVVWFAAKIYRVGILMYGENHMERIVQIKY
jgi:hypothetical protein